jgi:hypothetical protein
MGWWKIDPYTGMPAEGAKSSLSPPGAVLLNAVPGADDEEGAHYLGDGPWDMVASYMGKILEDLGAAAPLSDSEARTLLMGKAWSPRLEALPRGVRGRVVKLVEELWADVDWCYDEDWERPARPAERRWVCEYAVQRLTQKG